MKRSFYIRVERSLSQSDCYIEQQVDPSFLEISQTDEIQPVSPVCVQGKVSFVDEWVLFQADVLASFSLPCAVCNKEFVYTASISNWICEQSIKEIRGNEWDVGSILREDLLLQIPYFARCGGNSCLGRGEIEEFLRSEKEGVVETHTPFCTLEKLFVK